MHVCPFGFDFVWWLPTPPHPAHPPMYPHAPVFVHPMRLCSFRFDLSEVTRTPTPPQPTCVCSIEPDVCVVLCVDLIHTFVWVWEGSHFETLGRLVLADRVPGSKPVPALNPSPRRDYYWKIPSRRIRVHQCDSLLHNYVCCVSIKLSTWLCCGFINLPARKCAGVTVPGGRRRGWMTVRMKTMPRFFENSRCETYGWSQLPTRFVIILSQAGFCGREPCFQWVWAPEGNRHFDTDQLVYGQNWMKICSDNEWHMILQISSFQNMSISQLYEHVHITWFDTMPFLRGAQCSCQAWSMVGSAFPKKF